MVNIRTTARVLAWLACLLSMASPAAAQSAYPAISLDYRPLFDNACAEAAKQPANAEAALELRNRLDEFRDFWGKEERALLGTVPEVTGVPFRFREATAALFVCPGFPSMSLPLLINMRPYLAATANGPVAPLLDFSNNVMHEVLHRYVNDCVEALPGKVTPLLEKYKGEPQAVRNHLHLYAIMDRVYERLARRKDLDVAFATEQMYPRAWAVSKRARDIVSAEGAEAFVRELKARRP